MSYDIMVFDPEAAPKTKQAFDQWYQQQTQWAEDHNYDDPVVCPNQNLNNFFIELITTFPAMNGPFTDEDLMEQLDDQGHDAYITDYSIGKHLIYGAFAWSLAEKAHEAVTVLAAKHNIGFYDPSNAPDNIYFPDSGKLILLTQ